MTRTALILLGLALSLWALPAWAADAAPALAETAPAKQPVMASG